MISKEVVKKKTRKRISKIRKSKIELAGKEVMLCIMKLAKDTDMSCEAIAKKTSEEFSHLDLKLNTMDISRFFRKNGEAIKELLEERDSISAFRQKVFLNHKEVFAKDIKMLDEEIDKLRSEDSDLIEPDKRAKALAFLIDKKGSLLIRDAKLSGKLTDKLGSGDKTQINIFQETSNEKLDIIQQLKSFGSETKEIIIDKK